MARTESSSRAGARRGAKPPRTFRPQLLLLCVGATLSLVAWGVLVWVAIDSGRSARGGDSGKWGLLALASVGAVVCLFVCLLLMTMLLRRIGLLEERQPREPRQPRQPHRH